MSTKKAIKKKKKNREKTLYESSSGCQSYLKGRPEVIN